MREARSTGNEAASDLAHRQYRLGFLDLRMARRLENLNLAFTQDTGEAPLCALLCACGEERCTETVSLTLEEYERVRASPHRFVVALGHATEIDEPIAVGDGYEIVQLRLEYQDENPLTDRA